MSSATNTDSVNQRNNAAAVCRSNPTGLSSLFSSIDNCTSTTELERNATFASNTLNIKQDISALQANITDSLLMGDNMFGSMGNGMVTKQVDMRNEDLKKKKEDLTRTIKKNEAIMERSNRDFTYVKEAIPETEPKKVLHVLEDYTLFVLILSYLFMSLAGIYLYVTISPNKVSALVQGVVGSAVLSAFLFMVLFFMT